MGWSAWEVFRCTTCEQDPENCLSERLIQHTTDAMVAGGFRDAGYKIVWIDDCWQLKQRSASGALVPDPARWPHGLKAVADYVHSKGMLLGLVGILFILNVCGRGSPCRFLGVDAHLPVRRLVKCEPVRTLCNHLGQFET